MPTTSIIEGSNCSLQAFPTSNVPINLGYVKSVYKVCIKVSIKIIVKVSVCFMAIIRTIDAIT